MDITYPKLPNPLSVLEIQLLMRYIEPLARKLSLRHLRTAQRIVFDQ